MDEEVEAVAWAIYSRPFGYFLMGGVLILIGCFLGAYAAGYERGDKYQPTQYIIETTISAFLIFVSFLIVAQGSYLVFLAATNGRPENIGVLPVVVPELKLRDVQRQIFAADLVVAADDAALNQRPEAFDCARDNRQGIIPQPYNSPIS